MNKYFVNDIGIHGESERFIKEVIIDNEYGYLFDYDTVLDCGANIGTFSIWIYPKANRIFALEPNPKAIEHLRNTIKDNELIRITPLEIAITGSDGERMLKDTDDEHHQYGSGLINEKEGIKVKGVAIDTFMGQNNIEYIDLLKVDIEGCERELFSSPGFQRVANKIGTIIGEYHGSEVKTSIVDNLRGLGFSFTDVTNGNQSGRFISRKL